MENFKILNEVHCYFVELSDGRLAVYDMEDKIFSNGFNIRCQVGGGVIKCDCHVMQ